MANASILTKINADNSTNTITIYQPAVEHSGYITTLKATIRIKSISASNFPYIPDSTPPEAIEALLTQLSEELQYKEIILKLKKGTGNWIEKNTIRLFNKDPYYEIDLMAYLTDANTVDVADDLQIGLQMVEPLGTEDSIVVFGFVVEEKKNEDEVLAARIEALELALYGRLTGLPANSLVGSIAGGNATSIPSQSFVDLINNQTIGGTKTFTGFIHGSGIKVTESSSEELSTQYGFIKHTSGPLLFYIGATHPFFFKNNNGGQGDLIGINQDGTISYMKSPPAGTGTTCVFSGGKIVALSSSRENKENIRDLEISSKVIDNLHPKTFNYKGQVQVSHGFIVEEVAEVEPGLVIYEDGKPFSIQHSELVAVLWREVQKLREEMKSLSSQRSQPGMSL